MPYDIRIAHLYAHFLNIYGDRGNIITLVQRAKWRGINVTVTSIDVKENLDPDYWDLYFIGGGQDKQQEVIAQDLLRHSKSLALAIESKAVILAICGGYQLLGHYYRPHIGPELKGISLLDAYTVAGQKRMIGNVVVKEKNGSTLVGFENHSGKTYLGKGVEPLGKVVVGNGNNGEDKQEGAQAGTIFGTYLHGSLLPKNPHFADRLLRLALQHRHSIDNLPALDDHLEHMAHGSALSFRA